jgi:hypothetical protein
MIAARIAMLSIVAACGGPGTRPASPVAAPADPPMERCQIAGADAFDFLLGAWTGTEHAVDESGARQLVATSEIEARSILGGCAIEERWVVRDDKQVLFRALLVRSLERGTGQWLLSYVDDDLNHQLFTGRPHDDGWAFHRSRVADDGTTVEVRIVWKPTAAGAVQTIERSTDGGAAWKLGAEVELVRRDAAAAK